MTKELTPEQKFLNAKFRQYSGKASCIECNERDAHSRGLCTTCYQSARRAGQLDEYPTTALMADPYMFARLLFRFYPEAIADVAVEFDSDVVKLNLPPKRPFGAPKDWSPDKDYSSKV